MGLGQPAMGGWRGASGVLCVFRPSSGCWRGEQERCACSCTSGRSTRSVSVALSRARAERCRVGRETTDECVFLSATPTAYYICLCVLLYIGLSHVREYGYGSCTALYPIFYAGRCVRKSGSITIHMCPDRSVNLFFLIFYHLYHGEIRVGVRNGTRRMRARRAGHASLAISRSRASHRTDTAACHTSMQVGCVVHPTSTTADCSRRATWSAGTSRRNRSREPPQPPYRCAT